MRAEGKVWVVTGAGSGIGREVVRQLLRRGSRVAAVDISEDGLRQTAALAGAGERLSTHVVDITNRADTDALLGEVRAAHGDVDGLVNNAGIIQPFLPFAELDDADIRRVLDVNLMGTVHMVRAFLPHLLERPEAHLVNVSSMGGVFPFPRQTMYGASKAAVKLLTEGLYAELLDTDVRVTVVVPGPTATNISAGAGLEPSSADDSRMPIMSAQDAARLLIAGVERNRLHVYLGATARLTSLAMRIAPRRAIRFVRSQMDKRLPAASAGAPSDGAPAGAPSDGSRSEASATPSPSSEPAR